MVKRQVVAERLGHLRKILPPVFAKRLAPMAGLRNILVHDYLRVDPAKIHTFLKTHLGDFERFARAFEKFL